METLLVVIAVGALSSGMGTLLSIQTRHDGDVLALAGSRNSVFAAGADGKVVQFQQVGESERMNASDDVDIARGTVGEKWVYVGSKRTHTHDVRGPCYRYSDSGSNSACSAISGDGPVVALADRQRLRLYELGLKVGGERESVHIKRRKLSAVLKAAHCMVFSADSSRLLVAGPQGLIWVHALDVEVRAPGEWSRRNGVRVAKKLVNFPCGIIGLSLPLIASTSTSIIAYSSSAICRIDLSQPVVDEVQETPEKPVEIGQKVIGNGKSLVGLKGFVNCDIVKGSIRSSRARAWP